MPYCLSVYVKCTVIILIANKDNHERFISAKLVHTVLVLFRVNLVKVKNDGRENNCI